MGSLKNKVCFSYNHIFWYYLYLHQCFKLKKQQQVENAYVMTYTIEDIILYA